MIDWIVTPPKGLLMRAKLFGLLVLGFVCLLLVSVPLLVGILRPEAEPPPPVSPLPPITVSPVLATPTADVPPVFVPDLGRTPNELPKLTGTSTAQAAIQRATATRQAHLALTATVDAGREVPQ